jgi:predicted ribosome quality control (RQC) complex YloA/Tae2 family protein
VARKFVGLCTNLQSIKKEANEEAKGKKKERNEGKGNKRLKRKKERKKKEKMKERSSTFSDNGILIQLLFWTLSIVFFI